MTKPRDRHPSAEQVIEDVLLGASRIQALYVAARLGIPDLIATGPRSSTLLASSTGVHPGALHRLLRFLAADGWVALTEDGRFAATAQLEPLLMTSTSGMRGALLSTATRGWDVWANLLHSVETGQPAFDRVFGEGYFAEQQRNPESLERFDAGLAPGAAENGRHLARAMTPVECVADIGCGSGALLSSVLGAWPNARGIAFDSAPALELARKRFAAAGQEGRVELTPGDFFESIPGGAGLTVLSLILHDWEDEAALRILRNCQAAMSPGSRLAIIEQLLPEDPRAAPRASQADLGMLVMTGGRERTLNEYRGLIEKAGLRFDGVAELGGMRQATAIQASRGLF